MEAQIAAIQRMLATLDSTNAAVSRPPTVKHLFQAPQSVPFCPTSWRNGPMGNDFRHRAGQTIGRRFAAYIFSRCAKVGHFVPRGHTHRFANFFCDGTFWDRFGTSSEVVPAL